MKANQINPVCAEREERLFMLEPSELALDGAALAVEPLEPLRLARISGCKRSAWSHIDAGWHSPVGQRHFVARRLQSVPANVP